MNSLPEPEASLVTYRADAKPAVLVLPGWNEPDHSHYDTLKARLEKLGAAVAVMRFPAGPAEGPTLSSAQALQQALATYSSLSRETEGGCMVVVGMSYGGYLAALLCGQRPVHALALRCPALYPDSSFLQAKESLSDEELREFREAPPPIDQNFALSACSRFRGRALLVDCEYDEIIPPALTDRFAHSLQDAAPLQRLQLHSADHSLSEHAWRVAYGEKLLQWMQECAFVTK